MLERREGAAAAVGATAEAARQADADLGPLEVDPVGISKLLRVRQAAAHRHDMHRGGSAQRVAGRVTVRAKQR